MHRMMLERSSREIVFMPKYTNFIVWSFYCDNLCGKHLECWSGSTTTRAVQHVSGSKRAIRTGTARTGFVIMTRCKFKMTLIGIYIKDTNKGMENILINLL